jgi:hypothetical protein
MSYAPSGSNRNGRRRRRRRIVVVNEVGLATSRALKSLPPEYVKRVWSVVCLYIFSLCIRAYKAER